MHVARQSIELGDGDRRSFAVTAGLGQGGGELGAPAERVGAPARLDLGKLGNDLETFGLSEAGHGSSRPP